MVDRAIHAGDRGPASLEPREIADMAAYLASPEADAITGADFVVDGGLGVTGFKRQPSHPS